MNALSAKEKSVIRAYWRATYPALRFRSDGTLEAKQSLDGSWCVLETARKAKESAQYLIKKHADEAAKQSKGGNYHASYES